MRNPLRGQPEHEQQEGGQSQEPAEQGAALLGNGQLCQLIGDLRDLVGHAHEDEGADDDVEHGAARDEHQDALGVRRQPDVVLADEQLKGDGRRSFVRFRCSLFI